MHFVRYTSYSTVLYTGILQNLCQLYEQVGAVFPKLMNQREHGFRTPNAEPAAAWCPHSKQNNPVQVMRRCMNLHRAVPVERTVNKATTKKTGLSYRQ
jgi:hypothetical protein